MIHNNLEGECFPNHVDFHSRIFQELFKNRSRFEITHEVPYRKYFDLKGKVISQQIAVVDNLVDDVIRTLHDKPHAGTPLIIKNVDGSSQTF